MIPANPDSKEFFNHSYRFHKAHHGFAIGLAGITFVLIVAGALVTSNDAGLAVPDWPTSFGSLYKTPPMVGGVKFEHGHRMVAELVGLLTIVLAVWTWRVEKRSWIKKLAVGALLTIIAQGILGGITVLFYLPWWISTAHATLAQTFFCLIVLTALFTSRSWTEAQSSQATESRGISLRMLSILTVMSIYVQLILGAAFRHSGIKLLPHLLSALLVIFFILWTVTRILTQHGDIVVLRQLALGMLFILLVQLTLGVVAYLSRVRWSQEAAQPLMSMVVATVAHVAVGAILLATSVVLASETFRHVKGMGRTLMIASERGASAA